MQLKNSRITGFVVLCLGMETLTKNEEKIMHILWSIKKGFVKDVIEAMLPPHPPYNTVSSIVRTLEKKKFVGYKAYGKTHEYFPLVTKASYRKDTFKEYITNFFDDTPKNVVSYMVKEQALNPEEVRQLLDLLEKDKKNTK